MISWEDHRRSLINEAATDAVQKWTVFWRFVEFCLLMKAAQLAKQGPDDEVRAATRRQAARL